MQLIGYMDSPYVRRVAISMQCLGIDYRHRELSIWRDYDEFRSINPLVKVPTLVCDDGQVLVDSTLIIQHLEALAGRSLLPSQPTLQRRALGLVGVALIVMEKMVQLIYERQHRPQETLHAPWIERVEDQLTGGMAMLEAAVSSVEPGNWLSGPVMTQADITTAVAWRFSQHTSAVNLDSADYPQLAAFSARAEALPEFLACPLSE